jgi:hypothetical protein
LKPARSADFAVAFVTSQWSDVIADWNGRCRVLCWLTSTATNPFAIEQMRARKNFEVRHRHGMHAKVYIARGPRTLAIVGSANLSNAALSDDTQDIAGQVEAAVLLERTKELASVQRWFNHLWAGAREITDADLAVAKAAYLNNQAQRSRSSARGRRSAKVFHLPTDWRPNRRLEKLASEAREVSLRASALGASDFPKRLVPARMTREDQHRIIACLVGWAKHPGAFAPALQVPMARIRSAFEKVLDETESIEQRLLRVSRGKYKIPGLALPAWTMILHWWRPERYPPFNARTRKFLEDFRLARRASHVLSPHAYACWLQYASELAARLKLPSAGHIDRLVWLYTQDMSYDRLV